MQLNRLTPTIIAAATGLVRNREWSLLALPGLPFGLYLSGPFYNLPVVM
jgi:hypothetical protein